MSIFDNLIASLANSAADSFSQYNSIGSFGDIVFEVSSIGPYVKTISDYSRDAQARLTSHDIIGKKPVIEFIGPGLDTIKFKMVFNTSAGIADPSAEVEKIRNMMQTGQAAYLILNGKPVSQYKFIIESVSETAKAFNGRGKVIIASVDISAKEYIEAMPVVTLNEVQSNG